MNNAIILRRRKLGRTSCREIAACMQQAIRVVRNDQDIPAAKHVFRWGTTSNVPKCEGQVIYNSAASIHWCADKKAGRLAMQAAGIPVPKTFDPRVILASFEDGHEGDFGAAAEEAGLDREYVLRPARHAQGRNLLYGTLDSISDNLGRLYHGAQQLYNLFLDGYLSHKIDKVAEYRVFVCQGRVVWVAQKKPGNPDQVAWNVAQGGEFSNVRWGEWHMPSCRAAILAALLSKTDFCGVDVMVDADGNPYVLEVNSAPSQTSPYRQSCVAKAFDYMIQNGKEVIPCEQFKKWRDVAHPAILPDN